MKSVVLLDRSGSMAQRWSDVAGTLQTYFSGLPKDTKAYLYAFDTEFEEVWSAVPAGEVVDLDANLQSKNIVPRGMTALLDAVGKLAGKVAEVGKKRVQVVILTDGEENSSREVTKDAARKIVEEWKAKDYDVIFLGADFDAFSDASLLGVRQGSTLNYNTKNAEAVGQTMAARATSYASGQSAATMEWSDEDRKEAAK